MANLHLDPAEAHLTSVPSLIQKYHCGDIAEIGVERGALTDAILLACELDIYYLVDPWRPYISPSRYFNQARFQVQDVWDDLYDYVCKKFSDRTIILRLPSVEAAKLFEPSSLDFVFIDGNHSYEAVSEDIHAWLPILRDAGILAGHDYGNDKFPGVECAVQGAFPNAVQTMPGFVWFVEKANCLTIGN
jgi:hypothetical protein